MIFFLAAAITFHADFEGGALGRVERSGPEHFRCGVPGQADQDNRNRQASWYYFRIDGAEGKRVTVDLVQLLGEYNYKSGTHAITRHTRPLMSTDQRHWSYLPESSVEWLPEEPALRLKLLVGSPRVWIAHQVPYTNAHVAALSKEASKDRAFRDESIGKSVEGRTLRLWTIHDAPGAAPGPKPVVWLMFRQHAWETGSSFAAEGLVRWLLGRDEDAKAARRKIVWKILPTADPDGLAHGGVRFNRNGYDLNRNWDRVLPDKMPEIAAQQRAIYSWLDAGHKVDLFLTVHNTETAEYLDGPPLPMGERWFALLKGGTSFHPSRPYSVMAASTTEGKPGRMNVSQGLWYERKVPAFGMEQRVQFNEKLGRYPAIEDRLRFGAELAQSIVKLFE